MKRPVLTPLFLLIFGLAILVACREDERFPAVTKDVAWDNFQERLVRSLCASPLPDSQEVFGITRSSWSPVVEARVYTESDVTGLIGAVFNKRGEHIYRWIYVLTLENFEPGAAEQEVKRALDAFEKFCRNVEKLRTRNLLLSPEQLDAQWSQSELELGRRFADACEASNGVSRIAEWRRLEPMLQRLEVYSHFEDGTKFFAVGVWVGGDWGSVSRYRVVRYPLGELASDKLLKAKAEDAVEKVGLYLKEKPYAPLDP